MPRPVVVPPTRRSRIPVRSTIHASLVSRLSSRSAFVTTLSGSAVPQPVMRARDGSTPLILQDPGGGRVRGAATSRRAQPGDGLAAGEALAGDGEQALHGATERRPHLVAGDVTDHPTGLDVLALGDVGGRGEHARGGAD